MKRFQIILTVLLLFATFIGKAQCVQCDEQLTHLGTNASRLGTNTTAPGNSALASGVNSSASGNFSTAMGYDATASGMYAVAIGKNVQSQSTAFALGKDIIAAGANSIVIGCGKGFESSELLINNISNSIMFGVNSSSPAMTIRSQSTQNVPAFVGIGTTNPMKEFHVNGNAMISGSGKSLVFALSETSTYGDFGIRYTNNGLNFFNPNNGTPTDNLLFIKKNGNIGVGTGSPSCKLEVSGELKATELQSVSLSVTGNVCFRDLAGSSTKVVTVNDNGNLMTTDFSTFHDNMGNHTATQNINLNGKKIVGGTSGAGGLFVAANGNVRIGTGTMTPTKALEVNGTIRSKEVIVEVANWSDFVLDNNYNLMSLKDTERFIKQNGHLPNIPSAAEVEKEGIQLGEMNALLLQKVEELTLYIIELQNQIDKLNKDRQ